MSVILLDLNFTLVSNSQVKVKPFTKQIEGEEYNSDLLDRLAGSKVILITARPQMHKARTLKSILDKTGWQPDVAYFNEIAKAPPIAKRHIVETYLDGSWDFSEFLAIESNPATRDMYAEKGIAAKTLSEFMSV